MALKLQNKKYTQDELERIIEEEVNERMKNVRVGRKGEFPVGDFFQKKTPEELQIQGDHIYLASKLLHCDPRSLKMFGRFKSEMSKAMATATDGYGADWVPTEFSSNLVEAVKLELKVAALHMHFGIPQGTGSYKLPVEGGDVLVTLVPEATSDTDTKFTASTPGTVKVTFDAKKLAARVLTSKEMSEDAVYPVLEYIRKKIIRGLGEAVENCCINGDTSGSHQDSDVTDATDHRKAWKGYRKYALALGTATVDCGTFNITNLRLIRTAMGKYGTDPRKLAWIAGVKVYDKTLSLDEVKTVDKYGPNATILAGELAKLDGIPIIVSEKIRENLNASGVYDGATMTKTVLPLVYTPAFMIGDKRVVTVQVLRELYAETDQDCIVATQRLDMEPVYDTTTEAVVGLGYNIA